MRVNKKFEDFLDKGKMTEKACSTLLKEAKFCFDKEYRYTPIDSWIDIPDSENEDGDFDSLTGVYSHYNKVYGLTDWGLDITIQVFNRNFQKKVFKEVVRTIKGNPQCPDTLKVRLENIRY